MKGCQNLIYKVGPKNCVSNVFLRDPVDVVRNSLAKVHPAKCNVDHIGVSKEDIIAKIKLQPKCARRVLICSFFCSTIISLFFVCWIINAMSFVRCTVFQCPNEIFRMRDEITIEQTPANLTVGFVSDTYNGDLSFPDSSLDRVFQNFKARGVQLLVVSGDGGHGNYETFFGQIDHYFGEDFPLMLGIGNHDVCNWDIFSNEFMRRARRSGVQCNGEVGIRMSCHYKGFVSVFSSPSIGWCGEGTPSDQKDFTESELNKYRDAPWKMAAFHKPDRKLHVGNHDDDVGMGIYDVARKYGAFVQNGHTHHYVRSKTIYKFENNGGPAIADVTYNNNDNRILASGDDLVELVCDDETDYGKDGRSFTFIAGTGKEFRKRVQDHKPWLEHSITGDENGSTGGGLVCQFNVNGDVNAGRCEYEDNSRTILDQFSIRSTGCSNSRRM